MVQSELIQILLVEDDPADVRLTQEAMKKCRLDYRLHIVDDGVEAMDYLEQKGKYQNEILPDLIVLDLNLPRKDGRELLSEIRSDARFQDIPIIIFSTSNNKEDINKVYQLKANQFITKPVNWQDFDILVQSVERLGSEHLDKRKKNNG